MGKRNFKSKSKDDFIVPDDDDLMSEEQVSRVRNVRKNKQEKKKAQSKESNISQQNDILDIKQSDDSVRQHLRPLFLKRWDGESNYLDISFEEIDNMSPMLQVYWRCKCKHMNCIIFVQIGKVQFFAFEDDAIKLHEIFKKKLKRYSAYLMVNFWSKQVQLAKQQLFERNIPVLVMNEIQDQQYRSINNIIRREVNEVITPSLHINFHSNTFRERLLMTIKTCQNQCGVVVLDSETNKFYVDQFPLHQNYSEIRRVLNRYRPVELLISTNQDKAIKQIAKQICQPYIVQIDHKVQSILNSIKDFINQSDSAFFKQILSLFNKEKLSVEAKFSMFHQICCLDLLLKYLDSLQLAQKVFGQGIFSIECLEKVRIKPFFDSQVYENLQIFRIKNQDQGDGKQGTLIAFLDRCNTLPGKKLIRKWLNQPLRDSKAIQQRQQALKQILEKNHSFLPLHQKLIAYSKIDNKVADVYHWVIKNTEHGKLVLTKELNFQKGYDQNKNPAIIRLKEIVNLLKLLEEIQKLLTDISKLQLQSSYLRKYTQLIDIPNIIDLTNSEIAKYNGIPRIFPIIQKIMNQIVYNQQSNYVQPQEGINEIFDYQKVQIMRINNQLNQQLKKWKQQFNNDKVTYISIRARNQIQVPKASIKGKKSKELIFSSETTSHQRYTTARTHQLSEEIIEHQINMAKSYEPFLNMVIRQFCSYKFVWDTYVQLIAELDVLMSLAIVCKNIAPKCLPTFVEDELCIRNGFHVGLLQVSPQNTVPNTLTLNNQERILLLTGPNMGGKSTLLRQTCLLAIMAQIGCYVPAKQYRTKIFDMIFCRIGASDRIIQGKSTFYVELEQTKRIINQATPQSLIIIDELGRGTSTFDGMSIAQATLEYILHEIGGYTLFSTHYTPITDHFRGRNEIKMMKLGYRLENNSMQFNYQLQVGVAQKSFANNVGRLVGIPEDILLNAEVKAHELSSKHQSDENVSQNLSNILTQMNMS